VWQGKTKINSWEKLLKHMRVAFLPYDYVNNYVRTMYQQCQNFRQGTQSVDDYIAKFYNLVAHVDLGVMRQQFQDALNFLDPINVSEAHQLALHLEKTLSRRSLGIVGGSIGDNSSPNPTTLHVILFHHLHRKRSS